MCGRNIGGHYFGSWSKAKSKMIFGRNIVKHNIGRVIIKHKVELKIKPKQNRTKSRIQCVVETVEQKVRSKHSRTRSRNIVEHDSGSRSIHGRRKVKNKA